MRRMTRTSILAGLCLAALLGGYGAGAQDYIDTTSLPRGEGTRVLRAHPASTSFITPATVEEAGEAYRKILAEAGWQQYDQMAASHPMPTRIMRFKKGAQGLSVVIMPSPTQGGATSVNYTAELNANDRPEPQATAAPAKVESAAVPAVAANGRLASSLDRQEGKTVVTLSLRKPAAAEKAGMLPKAGQVKLLLGNMTDEEAVITIDKRTIKVAAGAGRQSPDGPRIDLPPGKYTYTLKLASRAAQKKEFEVGADETWGLLVGPGGVLPMHLY